MDNGTRPIKEAADDFLSHQRIAVTGVSRDGSEHGSNSVYKRLRDRGFEVFAVNPNAETVEGDRAYPSLKSIEGGIDAVVIGTKPERAQGTMEECVDLGIRNVWMHRSIGKGSVSPEAASFGRANGVHVIDGGCPLMFEPCSDGAHKAMKWVFTMTGSVPKKV
ncbi:MAG: CoA-binding protein [Acidimicrobiia bacterium]